MAATVVHRQYISPVAKVILYLEENYHHPITLCELASIANLSKFHFSRQFKIFTGMTCCEYLSVIRHENAKKLFATAGMNVSQVCYAVGYNCPTHFGRVFKKYEGCTPIKFRKKCLKSNSRRRKSNQI